MTNSQQKAIENLKQQFEVIKNTFSNSTIEINVKEYYNFISLTMVNDLPDRHTLARTTVSFIIGKRGKIQYFDFKNNLLKDYTGNIYSVVLAQSRI